MNKPQSWQVGLVLGVGVLAVSMAAIFIRLSVEAAETDSVGFSLFLAASRLMLSAIMVLPAWGKVSRSEVSVTVFYYAGAAGVCLALHFATWITSLSFTSIAASTVLVTTNPVWVALLSWVWFREKLTLPTGVGIAVALIGGTLIAFDGGSGVSSHPLLGNLLALIGAWMASFYLLFGREAQRWGLDIGSYVAIAYSTAALFLLPLPWLLGSGYSGYPGRVYLYVLLMAFFSQLIGHTSFNWTVRWISPSLVTLALLVEPIASSLLGYFVFSEVPSRLVVLGGLILLVGVFTAVAGSRNLN